ncbi:hypothetical protein FQA39_LY14246 [Lamprigera yunnana]|nr:hypothetical protein FQA39_LY14246 [Lamprigera yunnana]
MSLKIYNKDEVNKKILAKEPLTCSSKALLGQFNKCRDVEYEMYLSKKRQFLESVDTYRELNRTALYCNKTKLDVDTDNILRYHNESSSETLEPCSNSHTILLRKRTRRYIHDVNASTYKRNNICLLEPWFIRYLKLCKFIYAARYIILKNRLLKNLKILKQWNESNIQYVEEQPKHFHNVAYADIFARFIE